MRILSPIEERLVSGRSFPYQQDYAYALLESGRLTEARRAFHDLAADADRQRQIVRMPGERLLRSTCR